MNTQKEASHPLFYRVGSRRTRRWVLVLTSGGWLLIAAFAALASSSASSRDRILSFYLVAIASSVFQVVWLVWLGRTYVNAPRLADGELDERLVQVKNRAYRKAYLVLAPVAVIAWLLSLAALQLVPGDQGKIDSLILVFGVALLAGMLPTAIVAWQEPDPEPIEG